MMTRILRLLFIFFLLSLVGCADGPHPSSFNGSLAFDHIEAQLDLGPRIPGSDGSRNASIYIQNILVQNDWEVNFQDFAYDDIPLRNIVASKGQGEKIIILGAHYDTRLYSDQESDSRQQTTPVPGANDGASGTAVLLELSRSLQVPAHLKVYLVFFDAEDQGNINEWNWSIGAEYFAHNMDIIPGSVLIVDMVGDKDFQIYQEKNSSDEINKTIWNIAKNLSYQDYFIPSEKYAMIDDHLPFINRGYQTALLIDFDYVFWHTTQDTLDKISSRSLEMIGDVLINWINTQ